MEDFNLEGTSDSTCLITADSFLGMQSVIIVCGKNFYRVLCFKYEGEVPRITLWR